MTRPKCACSLQTSLRYPFFVFVLFKTTSVTRPRYACSLQTSLRYLVFVFVLFNYISDSTKVRLLFANQSEVSLSPHPTPALSPSIHRSLLFSLSCSLPLSISPSLPLLLPSSNSPPLFMFFALPFSRALSIGCLHVANHVEEFREQKLEKRK